MGRRARGRGTTRSRGLAQHSDRVVVSHAGASGCLVWVERLDTEDWLGRRQGEPALDGNRCERGGDPTEVQASRLHQHHLGGGRDLPSKVSTESCRPRLCRGLTTQWLLVAVMSNTSQPSSDAQRVRLSSRNRSDSLQERRRRSLSHPVIQPDTDGGEARVGYSRWEEVCRSPKVGASDRDPDVETPE